MNGHQQQLPAHEVRLNIAFTMLQAVPHTDATHELHKQCAAIVTEELNRLTIEREAQKTHTNAWVEAARA